MFLFKSELSFIFIRLGAEFSVDKKKVHFQKKSENTILDSISFIPDFVFLVDEWNPIIFSKVSKFEGDRIACYYCDANAPPLFKLYHQFLFYA